MKDNFNTNKCTTKWHHKMYDRKYEDDYAQAIEDYIDMSIKSPVTFLYTAEKVIKKREWGKHHFETLPDEIKMLFSNMRAGPTTYQIIGLAKMEMDKLYSQIKPNDIQIKEGNVWLTDGFTAILQLATGTGSPQAWNNATADLGVGNSSTAADKTDTGLLGGSTSFKAMDSGFPTTPSGGSFTCQGTWGTGDALFVWNEETFRNGGTALDYWNRSVTSLGDKSAVSQTWVLTGTISMT